MESKISPDSKQSVQATAYAADGRVNNSLMAQDSDAPVSNCAAQNLQKSGGETSKPSKPTACMEKSGSETLKAKVKAELDAGNPVSFVDFLDSGLHLFYVDGNRDVSQKHVKELLDSFKRVQRQLSDIRLCKAKAALEDGCKLHDEDGNELTFGMKDLEDYYAATDGQHRIAALKRYYSDDSTKDRPLSAYVRLEDTTNNIGIKTLIVEHNITSKKWTGANTCSYAETFIGEVDTVMQRIQDCVKKDKMSRRAAWKTYKMLDGYRKGKYEKAILEGNLTDELRGTQAEIERGDKIRRAMQVCCRNEPKMKRNSAIIDFIIAAYNSVADTDKAETMNLLLLFLTSLPEDKIKSALEKDSVEKKSEFFKAEWAVFREEVKTEGNMREFKELAEKAECEYYAMVASAKSGKVKVRKSKTRKSEQVK